LEELGLETMMILKWILMKKDEGCLDWIHLAQDREKWRDEYGNKSWHQCLKFGAFLTA
jgi:hypothetical protein